MNFKLLKDSRQMIPAQSGTYQWWSRSLGFIPIHWDGVNWRMHDGKVMDRETIRWWR